MTASVLSREAADHGESQGSAGSLTFVQTLRRRLIGLVVVLGGGLLLLLVVALGWFANDQDRRSALMSQKVVTSALAARVNLMNRGLTQYAVWDDPIEHVILQYNQEWADNTLGPYVYDQMHVEQSFVVMADGSLRYAMRDRRIGRDEFRIDPGLARLGVNAARMRGSKPLGQLAMVDGRPAIVGVQKIAGSTARFDAISDTRAAMIFVDFLDQASLGELSEVFSLSGLRLGNGPGRAGIGALALQDGMGRTIGWLEWDQSQPGRNTLRQLAPIVLALAVAVAVAAAIIGRDVTHLVAQMQRDQRAAKDALVRARVALDAAQAARGDAMRWRLQMEELEHAQVSLAELRGSNSSCRLGPEYTA